MNKTVFCVATSEFQAESILDELRVAGVHADQVSLFLADKTRAVVRGVTGAVTTDSAVGWLPHVESIVIASAGAFIGNGILANAITQAAAGSHKGAIARGLTGLGLASEQADTIDDRLRKGEVLLAIEVADEEMSNNVHRVLEQAGAEEVTTTGERPRVEAAPRLREEKWEKW